MADAPRRRHSLWRSCSALSATVAGAPLALVVIAGLVVPATAAAGEVPHLVIGFNATTPALVADAAAAGVTTDVLYNGAPSPTSALGEALTAAHMHVVDASISSDLYFWECHRTHTVAPPPTRRNAYCGRDVEPSYDSAEVLSVVQGAVDADASNPLVSGYWVLDDWASWDGGSGRALLQEVHQEIDSVTPGYPAICGFGASVSASGASGWDPATGLNYSNLGCDMVGFYNYADTQRRASSGSNLDWSMSTLLPAMEDSLAALGWDEADTPLLGIDQAWSGRFARGQQPGLSTSEMETQASAFCHAGATSIGWYGWTDSGFKRTTQTPANSSVIEAGIADGLAACEQIWSG